MIYRVTYIRPNMLEGGKPSIREQEVEAYSAGLTTIGALVLLDRDSQTILIVPAAGLLLCEAVEPQRNIIQ